MDNLAALNEKCGTTNNMTALSSFSTGISSLIMLLAVPLNLFIIVFLYKESQKKKLTFFRLILNLAAADLITGLVVCPSSLNFHLKEALSHPISIGETFLLHISMFFADGVALIALTTLSLDRLFCMVFPIRYFKGTKKKYQIVFLILPWVLGALLVVPYFEFLFIKQLAFYTGVNIVISIISLFVTFIGTTYALKKRNNIGKKQNKCEPPNRNQAKITRAFQRLIVVFIITYLPTAITMIYMNVCRDCNCVAVHVMRDVSFLLLLSSSVLRPLIFIWSMTILAKKFINLCKCCFCCSTQMSNEQHKSFNTIVVCAIGSTSSINEQ